MPGTPFAGSIRVPGRSAELLFTGWLEFMSLVNTLREGADDLPWVAANDGEPEKS
jgi:hypothetical protein